MLCQTNDLGACIEANIAAVREVYPQLLTFAGWLKKYTAGLRDHVTQEAHTARRHRVPANFARISSSAFAGLDRSHRPPPTVNRNAAATAFTGLGIKRDPESSADHGAWSAGSKENQR